MERAGVFVAGALAILTLLRSRFKARDALRWLEDVDSAEALEWVKEQNKRLPMTGTGPIYERILAILDSKEKIPYVKKTGDYLYNFWQDDAHERGIWRRTAMEEYEKKETKWETVIDLDVLSKKDNQKWVWKGSSILDEGEGVERELALVEISPGGGDATVVQEFNLKTCEFVSKDQGGFFLPTAKSQVGWKDRDTLIVGTDFGSDSMTTSGYPKLVKEWKRGTPLSDAKLLFTGESTDVSAYGYFAKERCDTSYLICARSLDFYTSKKFVFEANGLQDADGNPWTLPKTPLPLQLPDDANINLFADQLLVKLRSPWKGHKEGSLLSIPAVKVFEATSPDAIKDDDIFLLFSPEERVALRGFSKLKTKLILELLDNVKSKMQFWTYDFEARKWTEDPADAKSKTSLNSVEVWSFDGKYSNKYWTTTEGYTLPCTLSLADADRKEATKDLKQDPVRFDAKNLKVSQFETKSEDGTIVPYFIVAPRGEELPQPTLLYGYGGFEISMTPYYQVTTGVGWLEKGNVYVCANIRGGGEFGPKWHQAALKENRNKAFEDFEAVARDLVRKGITTPEQLGIMGGSNGGLLMGNMLTRSPELFGAIVCQVPLLDMKRFNKLLAGASWQAEYGNPDTEDWEKFLHKYSPYHNIDPNRIEEYPPILFTTSTRDDRVHPGHSRKMAKKMQDLGINNVLHYENIEGGHGGASTNNQRAFMWTISYQFLERFTS